MRIKKKIPKGGQAEGKFVCPGGGGGGWVRGLFSVISLCVFNKNF